MEFIICGVILVLALAFFVIGYVKASPDEAVIVSGLKKEPKVAIGTATFCIPFLEQVDRLNLSMLKIDVKTREPVKNIEFIDVSVDAVATIKLSSNPELIGAGLKNFLNKPHKYISDMVNDVLEGNIREIIGSMSLEEMVQDRKVFAEKVSGNAVPDMQKMGIEIISFNVQNFTDGENILTDLGMDNTMKIRKEASIVKANAEKEISIAKSQAEKEANDARVMAQQEIISKNNELAVRESELKKIADIKQAEADAAYEIQQETQRKEIETTKADADLEKATKNAEIKAREVEVVKQTLAAEIEQKAKSERVATEEKAAAELFIRQKQIEAERLEVEQSAIAMKAKAEAERFTQEEEAKGIQAKAFAEAEGNRAIYLAEAEGIRAKGLAEAEAIDKKADAMAKMTEAAVLEMWFKTAPDVAREIAQPLANIDSITMYGEGNTAKMAEDITKTANQLMNGINTGLGIDIKSIMSGMIGAKIVGSSPCESENIAETQTIEEELV